MLALDGEIDDVVAEALAIGAGLGEGRGQRLCKLRRLIAARGVFQREEHHLQTLKAEEQLESGRELLRILGQRLGLDDDGASLILARLKLGNVRVRRALGDPCGGVQLVESGQKARGIAADLIQDDSDVPGRFESGGRGRLSEGRDGEKTAERSEE